MFLLAAAVEVETEHHPRCGLGGPVPRRAQVRGYGGL